jgi:hypothetical protein
MILLKTFREKSTKSHHLEQDLDRIPPQGTHKYIISVTNFPGRWLQKKDGMA